MNHWLHVNLNVYVWGTRFLLFIYLGKFEVHNNGNNFIKSCWFIIWTCITFIWFSFGFNTKYEINNCLFDSIYYLLDNHLSSFQLKQNCMAHLNECLLLNIEKPQQCRIWELNPNVLFDLRQDMVTNEH